MVHSGFEAVVFGGVCAGSLCTGSFFGLQGHEENYFYFNVNMYIKRKKERKKERKKTYIDYTM